MAAGLRFIVAGGAADRLLRVRLDPHQEVMVSPLWLSRLEPRAPRSLLSAAPLRNQEGGGCLQEESSTAGRWVRSQ